MKLAIIGAPGSGKTHIAKAIASVLKLHHIESDQFFWQGLDVRQEVEKSIQNENWIVDGHITKVSDLVLPAVDKIIVIEGLNLKNLFRSLRRDWKNPSKAWFNFQNYEKMTSKRRDLVEDFRKDRPQDVIVLENFPDLNEGQLAAFCENLKTTLVKARKKPIKRQSP